MTAAGNVAENIAPMILEVMHTPAIPTSTEPVTVSARMVDESTSSVTATLYWRIDGDPTFKAVPMLDRGQLGDDEAGDGDGTVTPSTGFRTKESGPRRRAERRSIDGRLVGS